MIKKPITNKILKKTVKTTQAIEGYVFADKPVQDKISKLKKEYGIKVSSCK